MKIRISGLCRRGYLALAREELAEFDWLDGAAFTRKSRLAASGTKVEPDNPDAASVGDEDAEALAKGFAQIMNFRASEGSMLRAGQQIGEAQVLYDCWLQEAEEGHQTAEIEDCREKFQLMIILVRDLAGLPKNMAVVLPEDGEIGGIEVRQGDRTIDLDRAFAAAGTGKTIGDVPVTEQEIREAFADALAAQPPPPVEFVLTFAFNDTEISDQAFEAILTAAEEARSRAAAEVIVTGYADAPGETGANLAVSRARAEAVRKAVFFELRDAEKVIISVDAKGERDLLIATPNPQLENRRVVILVR